MMETQFDDKDVETDVDENLSIKHNTTGSSTLFSDEYSYIYCNECKLKYEGGCPEHGPLIYIDNAESKFDDGYTEEFDTQSQVGGNWDITMSRRKMAAQSVISGQDEEVYCQSQNDLPLEHLQSYNAMRRQDKFLGLHKHDNMPDVVPEYKNKVLKENSEVSISEVTRDTKAEPSMTENEASLDSIGSHERTAGDISDTPTECKEKSHKKHCRQESSKIISECKKNTGLHAADSGCRLQSNILIKNLHTKMFQYKVIKCNLCSIRFNNSSDLNAHKRTHIVENPYKSDVWSEGLTERSILAKHTSMHTEEKSYKCDICHENFTEFSDLKFHKKIHLGQKYDVTSEEVKESSILAEQTSAHSGEKTYKCHFCGEEFTMCCHLKSHMKIHSREKYKCDVCNLGFTRSSDLGKHEIMHTENRPFKCSVCRAGFAKVCNLKTHMRVHSGERPYKCDVCGVGFVRKSHLLSHSKTHTGEKPYKCDVCGMGFARKSHLEAHHLIHTGEKPYKCDVCGVEFARFISLIKHKRMHTGEKPYKCDVCEKCFADDSSLGRHKRTHTGEKPYTCDVCGVRFARSSYLKIHKRTHTGEKPYKCDVCSLRFSQSGHLIRHEKTHTGEKHVKSVQSSEIEEAAGQD